MRAVTLRPSCTLSVLVLVLAGCGGSEEPSPAPSVPVAEAPMTPPPRGISVKLEWGGDAEDAPVAVPEVPECAEPAPSGALVVGPEKGLANVLVWVPTAAGVPEVPAEVEVKASGCRFSPTARVVPPATPLRFVNEDSALHTFHLWRVAEGGETHVQNVAVPPQAPPSRWVLDEPGRYRVTSDRWPHMEAWVLVAPAGTAGVTGTDGRLELEDLDAGEYAVELFHPRVGSRTQVVTVPPGGPGGLYLTLQASSE